MVARNQAPQGMTRAARRQRLNLPGAFYILLVSVELPCGTMPYRWRADGGSLFSGRRRSQSTAQSDHWDSVPKPVLESNLTALLLLSSRPASRWAPGLQL